MKFFKLSGAWAHLSQLIRRRQRLLDWALKEEQYLFDAAEVIFLGDFHYCSGTTNLKNLSSFVGRIMDE